MKKHSVSVCLFVWLATILLVLSAFSSISAQEGEDGEKPWPSSDRFDLALLPEQDQGQPEEDPAERPANMVAWNLITFQSLRSGNWEIYTANENGYDAQRVTNHGSLDMMPRFNPGCTRIAFVSTRHGNEEIYTMNVNGSGVTRLTNNGAMDYNPYWSPDGSKIAFQSTRNGQSEIYVMNANGSGQTRLTHNSAYDGMPSWSPDGSKIAFASNRNDYGIWVMNADGSNQRLLVQKRYAQNPIWSPDGSRIAFDGDDDWNGWNEIWVMNANGSNRRKLYETYGNVDPYVRSWSPDGRYIAFTRTEWIYYQGGWYWTKAAPYKVDVQYTYADYFNYEWDVDWYPDWQKADIWAPVTQVDPIPEYARNDVTIRWSGDDPGTGINRSGVKQYEIQYRIGREGNWVNWLTIEWIAEKLFEMMPGETVYFRSRAVDNAGNVEAWPAGDGDTWVTFYNWAIEGRIEDQRGIPVPGTVISSAYNAFEVWPSDENGEYRAYFAGYDYAYSLSWQKPGYGLLPQTLFPAQHDTYQDVVLPPADNIIDEWGFESGQFDGETWLTAGDYMATVTDTQRHTGEYSAFLGRPFSLEPSALVASPASLSGSPMIRSDAAGRVHLLWKNGPSQDITIYYAQSTGDGTWSQPVAVNQHPSYVGDLLWEVGDDGSVHIVWEDRGDAFDTIYHSWLDEGGWHGPQTVYGLGRAQLFAYDLDGNGNGHLLWQLTNTNFDDHYYSLINSQEPLPSPERLFVPYDWEPYYLIVDHQNVVHLQWNHSGDELYHAYRKADGSWSQLELVAPGAYNWYNDMVVDDNNDMHMVWAHHTSNIYHSKRNPDGSWSSPVLVSAGTSAQGNVMQVGAGPGGELFIAWPGGEDFNCRQMFVARIDEDGLWQGTQQLSFGDTCTGTFWMQRQGNNLWMMLNSPIGQHHTFCYLQMDAGAVEMCTRDPFDRSYPAPVIDSQGVIHAAWKKPVTGMTEIWVSSTATAAASGNTILQQPVTIPAEMFRPTLSFLSLQGVGEGAAGLQVIIDDGLSSTVVYTATPSAGWQHHWVDLTAWSGQMVSLTLVIHEEAGDIASWAFLDEVTLGAAHPDTWLSLETVAPAAPGEILVLALDYGNRGGVEAPNSQISVTLPAGVTFVEASFPPATAGQTLIWDLGDLPAGQEATRIVISTTVAADMPYGALLPIRAVLWSDAAELEMDNNSHLLTVSVISRVYMPILMRH